MQEDLKGELEWAEERLDELVKFTQTEDFRKLPGDEQDLIVQQASALNTFKDLVKARIGE